MLAEAPNAKGNLPLAFHGQRLKQRRLNYE